MIKTNKTPIPIEQIALRFDQSELTPEQHLEFGLAVDQAKVLFVPSGTDAFSLVSAVDAGDLSHIIVRDPNGEPGAVLDIEWAKQQAREHLSSPDIQSFQDFTESIYSADVSRGQFWHEWLNSTQLGRPSLVVCHQRGHHNHLAPKDPCGQP
jgi:hypothetical protein